MLCFNSQEDAKTAQMATYSAYRKALPKEVVVCAAKGHSKSDFKICDDPTVRAFTMAISCPDPALPKQGVLKDISIPLEPLVDAIETTERVLIHPMEQVMLFLFPFKLQGG